MEICINQRKVVVYLAAVTVVLFTLSTIGQILLYKTPVGMLRAFTHLFFVGTENNLPTAYSSFLMLAIGFLCFLFWRSSGEEGRVKSQWLLLGICFFYMSADELLVWHEKFLDPARFYLQPLATGFLYYTWVVPGIAGVVLLAAIFFTFSKTLPKYLRMALYAGFIFFFAGALGMESVAGRHAELYGTRTFTYAMLTTLEEALEFAGLLLLIRGMLRYWAELGLHFTISVQQHASDPPAAEGTEY